MPFNFCRLAAFRFFELSRRHMRGNFKSRAYKNGFSGVIHRKPQQTTGHHQGAAGFTLVELLICLVILGAIATFTIPKIITNSQNNTFNAVAKEDAATIAAAYSKYVSTNEPSSSVGLIDLTSYLNYLSVDSTSLIDSSPGSASLDCAAWSCYRMANGSMLAFDAGQSFGATDSLAITYFYVDPDGTYSGTTTGNGKSVIFFIYYNGRITTRETPIPSSHDVWGTTYNPSPGADPTWFQW